ncbi:MAG: MFS transporter [Simkaniaceae bacterium]|nr:MFS transporter [Simkaniaceae bacterium]
MTVAITSRKAKICLKVLEVMLQARLSDDKMMKLVRQNKGGTFHLSVLGHEMVGAVAALSLIPGKDWAFPYYRDRTFAIGLGCPLKELFGAFLAREVPHHSGGRMMPDHFSHKSLRIPCQSSVVGSQFLHAVGLAKGIKLQGKDEVVYVSGGDGSTSQGDFHEALNFSTLHKLPVIFVIQDNGWAISVPVKDQTSGGSIAKLASGYEGLSIVEVDGTDYEPLSEAMEEAVLRGRSGEGPTLFVAKIPRIGPHSSSDDPQKYKTKDDLEEDLIRDPLPRYEQWLLDQGILTEEFLSNMRERLKNEIDRAALEGEGYPHPQIEEAAAHVLAPSPILQEEVGTLGESLVMVDTLNHALDEEMARDPSIIVFGQDVAYGKGGVFGVTRGLTAKFSNERCFNTPLAESTIVGCAIGLAMSGYFKPVVEIQFCDYMWTGINQLINELSSIYYRSNGEWNCPVVIRMPYGGYIQGGPYHSQAVEAYLNHCPGLKVVIPSNAADAKGLLKGAMRDPNPVIFLEHKALYRQRAFCARPEPSSEAIIPLGKAALVQEGEDLTLVTWGMTTFMGYEVAHKLKGEGIHVELIDLRTIAPLDVETVMTSVKKTGKLLIAHEAVINGGFGGELASQIMEKGFEYLDAPIKRIGAKNCPVAYAKGLEEAILPQKQDLIAAIKELAAY